MKPEPKTADTEGPRARTAKAWTATAQTAKARTAKARTAKAKFAEIVLVCSKCARRQGIRKRALREILKGELKRTGSRRRLRIVQTGCLGPCPKRALAVATAASVGRGRILLLDPAATPEAVLGAILPELRPNAALAAGSAEDPSASA